MKAVLWGAVLVLMTARVFSSEKMTVRLAIAANLSTVILELKKDFESVHPDIHLETITGSSGKLAAQILAGAPYDVFLSADMEYPQKVCQAGKCLLKPVPYAGTILLLFTTIDLPVSDGLSVLTNPKVRKIAIANPELAPHGRAAYFALSNAGLLPFTSNRFVYAENIMLTAQYVTVSADVGFISLPLLFNKDLAKFRKEGVYYSELDRTLYPKIEQGMALLKHSEGNPGAKMFYDYVLSGRAGKIFRSFGYDN